jgi:glycosyltransferase involved in cell wall biosynthesis
MIIGFDAFYLSSEKIDGMGNYLLRLLVELSKIDRINYYYLYTPCVRQNDYAIEILKNSRFKIVNIVGFMNSKRRFWLQSPSLIKRIIEDEIDFFLGGAEYFPLFLPRSIRIGVTVHDVAYKTVPDEISRINSFFYRYLFPFFIKKADVIFTVSNYSKSEIENYFSVGNKKIVVVHNGIPLEKYKSSIKKKDEYILFVGTLQPRKNLINLIKAYELISNKISERLVIVGAKSWRNSFIRHAIERLPEDIKNRIEFLGYVDGKKLIELYQRSSLFVLPSIHEGFGLPIIESMASGTAVITTRCAAIPEIGGNAVIYAEPYEPSDIAEKILLLLSNNKLRKQYELKGLKQAKLFDVSMQGMKYYEFFAKFKLNNKLK